jgi:hypothetical protein
MLNLFSWNFRMSSLTYVFFLLVALSICEELVTGQLRVRTPIMSSLTPCPAYRSNSPVRPLPTPVQQSLPRSNSPKRPEPRSLQSLFTGLDTDMSESSANNDSNEEEQIHIHARLAVSATPLAPRFTPTPPTTSHNPDPAKFLSLSPVSRLHTELSRSPFMRHLYLPTDQSPVPRHLPLGQSALRISAFLSAEDICLTKMRHVDLSRIPAYSSWYLFM